jgi:predicted amidophosphoribosyltransferase
MEIKVCKKCNRAFNAEESRCPSCGRWSEPYSWDEESWANMGCLLVMIFMVLMMIILPVLFMLLSIFR